MKFVNLQSAKGLKVNTPVYTLNAAGQYGFGKLVSKTETAKGTEHTFEAAMFTDEGKPPQVKATIVNDITHVCVIKDKAEEDRPE